MKKFYRILKPVFLLLFLLSLPKIIYCQSNFQLNGTGTSYIYWPFPSSQYLNPNQGTNGWGIFGYGHNQGTHVGGDSYAEDWSKPSVCLTPMYSPISGTVIFSGLIQPSTSGYGNQVVVRSSSNNQFAFRVAHLDTRSVSVGDNIVAGVTRLGYIGTTGQSTGCHAHVVLYRNILSSYNGSTGLSKLQSGYGTGSDQYAAPFLMSAIQTASAPTVNFFVNGNPLPSGWKFWKGYNYSIRVQIVNRPTGDTWTLFVLDTLGNVISPNPITGSSQDDVTFTYNPGTNYQNHGGFKFRVSRNDPPTYTPWGVSQPFAISSIPVLEVKVKNDNPPDLPLRVGGNATVSWTITGGIPGYTNGGWVGGIRFQWYKNDSARANLIFERPVGPPYTYSFIVPATDVNGAWLVGNNVKLAGVNSDAGTSLPPGSVYDFTDPFSITGSTGIHTVNSSVPTQFALYSNYPNPFNPTTKIKFDLPISSDCELIIFDVLGEKISTLINGKLNSGSYEVEWNASDQPSGVYYVKFISQQFTDENKIVLIK
jgi:murein DD-endopeptidase MepM/ murein hydrolase activator NlpD